MTKAEKLKEIIGLAVNAGWSELWKGKPDNLAIVENEHGLTVWIDERTFSPEGIIFRHDFLKAYFGEGEGVQCSYEYGHIWSDMSKTNPDLNAYCLYCDVKRSKYFKTGWQYHAQGLVLAEDYIEYLWKHRPKS